MSTTLWNSFYLNQLKKQIILTLSNGVLKMPRGKKPRKIAPPPENYLPESYPPGNYPPEKRPILNELLQTCFSRTFATDKGTNIVQIIVLQNSHF